MLHCPETAQFQDSDADALLPTALLPSLHAQRNIVLKQFRGIPLADLEMVMPEKRVGACRLLCVYESSAWLGAA
jgi:hypothetical protein